MKKYEVLVEETLSKMVEVEAKNEDEAFYIVQKMYNNCEIVLDYEDFSHVEIGYEINEK